MTNLSLLGMLFICFYNNYRYYGFDISVGLDNGVQLDPIYGYIQINYVTITNTMNETTGESGNIHLVVVNFH
jgi:hypothetical protein